MDENKSASIILSGEVGKTEEFKRPGHSDFKDAKELKGENFTGVRHNSITDCLEIWTWGDLRDSMPCETCREQPEKWLKLYADIFGLEEVAQPKPNESN